MHTLIVFVLDTSEDVDALIERVDNMEELPEPAQNGQQEMSFGFAKIWERQKNTLEAIPDSDSAQKDNDDDDFWAAVLERCRKEEEAQARAVVSGRGVRRRATKVVS